MSSISVTEGVCVFVSTYVCKRERVNVHGMEYSCQTDMIMNDMFCLLIPGVERGSVCAS